ncbi:transporter substrate-binding domain-containing protein [Myceligenerans crystallogenes]|uniref:transporter substrate-binding domain-containing protein n=1 Tax=Myceligenerans crystallogenes TaxID=316335 RepID=UPI0031DD265E
MARTGARSRALAVTACVGALLVAGGCGQIGGAPPPDESETAEQCASLLGADAGGRIVIGMHSDQPGMNFQEDDARRSGFDYEFAKYLGEYCGMTVIEQDVSTPQRQELLQDGVVDVIVASYSITDARKLEVSFAGPYLKTKQGVMVGAGSGIESARDLAGRKVCAGRNSTSWDQMIKNLPGITAVEAEGFGECTERLLDGEIDAVTTDQVLLYGYEHEYSGLRVLPGEQFGSAELYGIGLRHGDVELCEFFNQAIKDYVHSGRWVQQFKNNLPEHLDPDDFKPVDHDLTECPDPEAEQ